VGEIASYHHQREGLALSLCFVFLGSSGLVIFWPFFVGLPFFVSPVMVLAMDLVCNCLFFIHKHCWNFENWDLETPSCSIWFLITCITIIKLFELLDAHLVHMLFIDHSILPLEILRIHIDLGYNFQIPIFINAIFSSFVIFDQF
jgi:hypothetical protein